VRHSFITAPPGAVVKGALIAPNTSGSPLTLRVTETPL
jgi:hypothetical protein